MSPRGGRREGAGRKRRPDITEKATVRLPDDLLSDLRAEARRRRLPLTRVVEARLRHLYDVEGPDAEAQDARKAQPGP